MDTKKTYKTIKEDLTQFANKYFSEDKEIISFLYKLLDELKEDEFLDISRGKPEIWASSIILIICRLNYLLDKSKTGSLEGLNTICDFFKTNKHTVGNKASQIQNELDLNMGNEDYSREEIADSINIIQLPNGFVITIKHFKEIESMVGQLTRKNFDKKFAEYHELSERKRKEEKRKIEAEQLKYGKELQAKRLVEMDERAKLAHEEKQRKLKEKWDQEKENQPDFLDMLGLE